MTEYKYTTNKKTKYSTLIYFILLLGVAIAMFVTFDGGYFTAWFISIVIAIIALMTLSIPRSIILNEDGIDICCISDYTYIAYDEIASIKSVENREMKLIIPIFAGVGFFGYYGIFLDLKSMDFVKIYATKWTNFIEITDIYEDKYYISCDRQKELIEEIESKMSLKTQQNE